FLSRLFSRPDETEVAVQTPAEAPSQEISKAAAKQLVQQGRKLLAQGKFEQAHQMAVEAGKHDGTWLFGDSPERLLRDVEFAQAKAMAAGPAPTKRGDANQVVVDPEVKTVAA